MVNRIDEVKPELMQMFPEKVVARAIPAINFVLNIVNFTSWTPQEIVRKLTKRSYSDIVNERDVNHLYPCVDTAVVGTFPLFFNRERGYMRMMTDKGALDEYRRGRANIVHLDCVLELEESGVLYGFDIGCGDLTLTRLKQNQDPNSEQVTYLTTRHEVHSREWNRKTIFLMPFYNHPYLNDTPVFDLLETNKNLVIAANGRLPYGLTRQEILTCKDVKGEKNPITSNGNFDVHGCQEFNDNWTMDFNDYWSERAGKDFPKLKPYKYVGRK